MTDRPSPDPNLSRFADEITTAILARMNAHAVGKLEEFDEVKQCSKVSIGYKRTLANGDLKDYPPLVDCPTLCMGGGKGRLTFDISPGDDCLALFNDRNMDTWIQAGQVKEPASNRLHAFSDALVIVGFRPFCRALSNYFVGGTELAHDQTTIQLTSKLKLANAVTDLKTMVNGLIDLVAAAQVSGVPLSNAAAITAYKVQVGALLT